MKRETRIALLVGLTFIALFGLVLGRRSMDVAAASRGEGMAQMSDALLRPGPEIPAAAVNDRNDRPVLRPPSRPGRPPATPQTAPPARPEAPRRAEPPPPAVAAADPPPEARSVAPPARRQVPRQPKPRIYTVQAGDNLTKIARKVYGRGREREYRRIFQANRGKLPNASTVSPGQRLVIPPLAPRQPASPLAAAPQPARRRYTEMTLEAMSSQFRRGRQYVVRSGDSLTDIARRELGSTSRLVVRRLYDANRDRITDPNRLPVGMPLRIPR